MDPYQTLGIDSTATLAEARIAYRNRVRVLHPDRFDPVNQKEEWEIANQMMRDVNAAWDIIKNRKPYPSSASTPPPRQTQRPSPRPTQPETHWAPEPREEEPVEPTSMSLYRIVLIYGGILVGLIMTGVFLGLRDYYSSHSPLPSAPVKLAAPTPPPTPPPLPPPPAPPIVPKVVPDNSVVVPSPKPPVAIRPVEKKVVPLAKPDFSYADRSGQIYAVSEAHYQRLAPLRYSLDVQEKKLALLQAKLTTRADQLKHDRENLDPGDASTVENVEAEKDAYEMLKAYTQKQTDDYQIRADAFERELHRVGAPVK